MSDFKLKRPEYFGLSAYLVLKGMVVIYGMEKIRNALAEITIELETSSKEILEFTQSMAEEDICFESASSEHIPGIGLQAGVCIACGKTL